MKTKFIAAVLMSIVSFQATANDPIQDLKLQMCQLADSTIQEKSELNKSQGLREVKVANRLDKLEKEMKEDIHAQLNATAMEGLDKGLDEMFAAYDLFSPSSSDNQDDLDKLFDQIVESSPEKVNSLFDYILPKVSNDDEDHRIKQASYGNRSHIDFNEDSVRIKKFLYTKESESKKWSEQANYEVTFVYDRKTKEVKLEVELYSYRPDVPKVGEEWSWSEYSDDMESAIISLGYDDDLNAAELESLMQEVAEKKQKLNESIEQDLHPECFALLYGDDKANRPKEDDDGLYLLTADIFEGLNRQQVIAQDQSILVEGKLSAHGEASTQDVN